MSIDVFFMTLYGEVKIHHSIHSHPISSQQRFLLKPKQKYPEYARIVFAANIVASPT